MTVKILRLNKSGLPTRWLTPEQAATLYSREQVVWHLGADVMTLRGGFNKSGVQSRLDIPSIIACDGNCKNSFVPVLSNALLFRRDGYRCMYCGLEFRVGDLTRDHIKPRVQGGGDRWTNVVSACRRCNHFKGGRTPEEASMELLAIPFEPNLFEFMYLANRHIIGDQMEYLSSRFSGQRTWAA